MPSIRQILLWPTPQQVDDKAVEPVHDHKEEVGFKTRGLKVLHSAAHGFLQSRQLIFQGDYFRFLMRADLEHSDFLLFAHKPYLRFQNWDGIVHEIFLNCKPFFAQNSCRSGALVIDYFPPKMPLPVVENFTPITFHRFSRQIPWAPLRIANEHSFPITNITVTLSLNVYKK